MKSLASLNPKLIYYHASGDLPETVEMELRDASGRYVTTAVMQARLLLSDVRVFPCGDGDDVKLDPLQYIAVLDFLEKSRERLRSKETVKTLSARTLPHSLGTEDYSTLQVWVDEYDPGLLHLLRHFIGRNRHWTVRTDAGDRLADWVSSLAETPLGRYGC